jgi:hypothetical protein
VRRQSPPEYIAQGACSAIGQFHPSRAVLVTKSLVLASFFPAQTLSRESDGPYQVQFAFRLQPQLLLCRVMKLIASIIEPADGATKLICAQCDVWYVIRWNRTSRFTYSLPFRSQTLAGRSTPALRHPLPK